ncbi:glycosyltransferase family 2 protein [Thiomicrospira sp. R3]|uniref:glycosyltransferase family A protein n=1 Tax=Thiomicrospira sp. R3 TaxID=3035472 RepID=UPI00259B4A41|nr:glycosyltransferase family 2 protein [Thiomicrospira sp. R3]WFE68800.1 glycosyltransferase family 2 protein [Thiomicrospira sp. R3]
MDVAKPYFTVFTPTYNRADRLHRVYDSLKEQTFKDFEWLIVDDGSTDNTKEVVDSYISEGIMLIRYIWQPNGHKKIAFNHGVKEAKGFLFIPADSDDTFDCDTLEIFKVAYETQPSNIQQTLSGVVCLCKDEQGNVIGDEFSQDNWITNGLEMRYKYHISGEKWGCIRTSILKHYPFPEIEGHVPESVIWTPIAKKYNGVFINKTLRTYYVDECDSITNSGYDKRNAHGAFLLSKMVLENELKYFFYSPLSFIKAAANFTRFRLGVPKTIKEKYKLRLENNQLMGGGPLCHNSCRF